MRKLECLWRKHQSQAVKIFDPSPQELPISHRQEKNPFCYKRANSSTAVLHNCSINACPQDTYPVYVWVHVMLSRNWAYVKLWPFALFSEAHVSGIEWRRVKYYFVLHINHVIDLFPAMNFSFTELQEWLTASRLKLNLENWSSLGGSASNSKIATCTSSLYQRYLDVVIDEELSRLSAIT